MNNGERLNVMLTLRRKQGCPLLLFLFSIVLGVLITGMSKERKGTSTGKVKVELFLFADDTTVKIENCKYSILKTPGINEFNKVTEYKINISFLHN